MRFSGETIRSLSPGCRIASAILFAAVAATVFKASGALVSLVVSLACVLASGLKWNYVFKRWLVINTFVLFIWLLTPWAVPGEEAFSFLGLSVSREGIELCWVMTLKINALFFAFISLVSSMSFTELSEGLKGLKFPDKLSALVLFTARGVEELQAQYVRLKEAASLRGFVPKANLHTYRTIGSFIAILFLTSYMRSVVLKEAMMLRGFDGKIRTLRVSKWTNRDSVFFGMMAAAVAVAAYFGYGG